VNVVYSTTASVLCVGRKKRTGKYNNKKRLDKTKKTQQQRRNEGNTIFMGGNIEITLTDGILPRT
jgi:hypothetical protein